MLTQAQDRPNGVSSGAGINAFEGAVFEDSEGSLFATTAGSVFIYDHNYAHGFSPVRLRNQLARDSGGMLCRYTHPENTVHNRSDPGSSSSLVQQQQQYQMHTPRGPITAFKQAHFRNHKASKQLVSEGDIYIAHAPNRACCSDVKGGDQVEGALVQTHKQAIEGWSGTPLLDISPHSSSLTHSQMQIQPYSNPYQHQFLQPAQDIATESGHAQSAPSNVQTTSHVPNGPHGQITPYYGSSNVQSTAYVQNTAHGPCIPHTQSTSHHTPLHVQSASHSQTNTNTDANTANTNPSSPNNNTNTNIANTNPSTDVANMRPPSPPPTPSSSPSPSMSMSISTPRSRSEPAMLRESLNKQSLSNKPDRVLFSLHRNDKTADLYKIVQVEIRYDKDNNNIPYSILSFRLQRGDDSEKQCTAVRLRGKFVHDTWHYPKLQIKNICCSPEDGPASLAEMEVQKTSQTTAEATLGLSGLTPSVKGRLNRMSSQQTTVLAGQHARGEVANEESEFVVNLSVDAAAAAETKGAGMSVVDPLMFALLLRLGEHRQPMKLELELEVTYRSRRGAWKTLNKTHTEVYMGHERFDILKV
ncbi:hypothetical protein JR316_0001598 [Psilocybe cubensis]|uniref:Uncharacterized protein n=2 Tax=Psilocybe cubensis TaxID=181762 RepID=A0A8H7Y3V4_PSICU|nr:hypothetical protein JR316_0001598 [Psilocybe cubensis]KAH9484699.1 hypothetical protein JR316_0001598 [Psilocybe cubensis]